MQADGRRFGCSEMVCSPSRQPRRDRDANGPTADAERVTRVVRAWLTSGPREAAPIGLLPRAGETGEDREVVGSELSSLRSVCAVSLRRPCPSQWPGVVRSA